MSEEQNELFEDRPAPWSVDKHQFGAASVIAANGATVLTTNGVALAEFIADAANAFASDEWVFVAADNNARKITVLTIQRDDAREKLATLHNTLRRMGQSWLTLAVSLVDDPRRQGESRILKDCADDLERTFRTALAGDAGRE